MKKLLSLALALVLVLSLSVTAFAESVGPTVTNGTQNVTGKYVEGTDGGTIYKVDITWGSMAFTYTAASKGTWSTSNHTYEGAKDAAWSWADGADKITVTNHSNAGINVVPTYTADSNYATVIMNFPGSPFSMDTADNGENGAAGSETSSTITVTPSGDLPKDTNGKIGTITLSIAGKDNSSTPTDEKAVITGIEVKVGNTTYKSGETVTLNKNSGNVTITVKGTNLQNESNIYLLSYADGSAAELTKDFGWYINENGTEAKLILELEEFKSCVTAFEIYYTNDNFETITYTGVSILYERSPEEIATINDVSITVDGQTYNSSNTSQADPAKITKDSTVSVTVTGENFAALNRANLLYFSPDYGWIVAGSEWTIDTTANTATQTFSGSEFKRSTSAFEFRYTNDGENYTGSGVWIIYEE